MVETRSEQLFCLKSLRQNQSSEHHSPFLVLQHSITFFDGESDTLAEQQEALKRVKNNIHEANRLTRPEFSMIIII